MILPPHLERIWPLKGTKVTARHPLQAPRAGAHRSCNPLLLLLGRSPDEHVASRSARRLGPTEPNSHNLRTTESADSGGRPKALRGENRQGRGPKAVAFSGLAVG